MRQNERVFKSPNHQSYSFFEQSYKTTREKDPRTICIVCGGGPAPGYNGVIAAVTMKALDHDYRVIGIRDGFKNLLKDPKKFDKEKHTINLLLPNVGSAYFHGGTIIGTSRGNPLEHKNGVENCVKNLRSINCIALVSIGGDEACTSSINIQEMSNNLETERIEKKLSGDTYKLICVHIPNTIDNNLPLPESVNSFGFSTAREIGATFIENLMYDSSSTKNRFFVVVCKGRNCGSLALGISQSAGAHLCLIPEEFLVVDDIEKKRLSEEPDAYYYYLDYNKKIEVSEIIDIIEGMLLKRLLQGKTYGVLVISEGIIYFIISYIQKIVNNILEDMEMKGMFKTPEQKKEESEKLLLKHTKKYFGDEIKIEYDVRGNVNMSEIGKQFGPFICAQMKKRICEINNRRECVRNELLKMEKKGEKEKFDWLRKHFSLPDSIEVNEEEKQELLNEVETFIKNDENVEVKFTSKSLGYEIRCQRPNALDREYTRIVGWSAIHHILKPSSSSGCLISLKGGKITTIPFSKIKMIGSKIRLRPVNILGEKFKCGLSYMQRLNQLDFQNSNTIMKYSVLGGYSLNSFKDKFESIGLKLSTFY